MDGKKVSRRVQQVSPNHLLHSRRDKGNVTGRVCSVNVFFWKL